MIRTMIRMAVAALAAASLLAPSTVSAAEAGAATIERPSEGVFRLELKPADGSATSVKLLCPPHRGSHPHRESACADLVAADGRVADIRADSAMCTRQYAPVTVYATGMWHAEPRRYEKRFGNVCEAVARTGGDIFDF